MPRLALWLIPDEPAYTPLQQQLDLLAATWGGPRFIPHVTLLSGIRSPDFYPGWAAQRGAITLQAEAAGAGDAYFSCLFYPLPCSAPLQAARASAAAALGLAPRTFRPHLSLLYSDIPLGTRITLARAQPPPPLLHLGTLALVRVDGPVHGWQILARTPLAP